MKTITTLGDQTNKVTDTATVFKFCLWNNGVPQDITNKTVTATIANSTGYLFDEPVIKNGTEVDLDFSSDTLATLVPDTYFVEINVTDEDGDIEVYPTEDSLQFTVTKNLRGTAGNLVPQVTFDSVLKAVDTKVAEYLSTVAKGDKGDEGPQGPKGDPGNALDETNIVHKDEKQYLRRSSGLLPLASYIGDEFVIGDTANYLINDNLVSFQGSLKLKDILAKDSEHTILKGLPFSLRKPQVLLQANSDGLTYVVKAVKNTLSMTSNTDLPADSVLNILAHMLVDLEYQVQTGTIPNGSKYWQVDIQNADIKLGFPIDNVPRSIVQLQTGVDFALQFHTSLLVNAGRFYETGKLTGTTVADGKIIANNLTDDYSQNLVIDYDGNLSYRENGYDFTNDKDVRDSVNGFYAVINDSKILPKLTNSEKALVNTDQGQPRSIIYQKYNGDYGILVIAGRVDGQAGATYEEMAAQLMTISDIRFAFNLDGGGSAAIVEQDTMTNPSFDTNLTTPRPLGNFLYFENKSSQSINWN